MFGASLSDRANLPRCKCCYNCIRRDSQDGCQDCNLFLDRFFPKVSKVKMTKTVSSEIKEALSELFSVCEISYIKVENKLEVSCNNFIGDLLKVVDELKQPSDIVRFWHIETDLAVKVFSVLYDVLFSGAEEYVEEDESVLEDSEYESSDDDEDEDVSWEELNTAGNSSDDEL